MKAVGNGHKYYMSINYANDCSTDKQKKMDGWVDKWIIGIIVVQKYVEWENGLFAPLGVSEKHTDLLFTYIYLFAKNTPES